VASDSTAVCELAQARSGIWESSSGEASRATVDSGALERKTVRSGFAYDINSGGGSVESSERARRLKEELGSVPVTGIEDRVAYRFVKRAFDIVFSAAVLVVFCWLFAIIAILIKVDDPKGPVFFSQERVGKDGRTFRMLKFRSMCVDAEEKLAELRELNEKTGPVFKIAEDPRITRVGKWLRKLSLASGIIGTPGDGESTKSLSRSANSSLDLQLCERRPGLCCFARTQYKRFQFLSVVVFRDARGVFNRTFTRISSLVPSAPLRGYAEGCSSFLSISKAVRCNDGGECCRRVA